VIMKKALIFKAVLVFTAGMAFFVSGCARKIPTVPSIGPSPEEVQDQKSMDIYLKAEKEYQSGNYRNALVLFNIYLGIAPKGETARNTLYRIASIKYKNGLYEDAIYYYKRIIEEYPGHPENPRVKYDMVYILYTVGDYDNAISKALEWLKENTGHPLTVNIHCLLGRIYNKGMDKVSAFYWFLMASNSPEMDTDIKDEIHSSILDIIDKSDVIMLDEMLGYKENNPYIPNIYHKLAILYLDSYELDKAKEAAMELVRSTKDQYWVDIGRKLLERITGEISIKIGRIGCLLPLSGPFAIYGQEALNGIQLGMGLFDDETNGLEVELVIRDTGGTVKGAISGVEELANDERVMAIIGPVASKTAIAAAEKAQELQVPIITLTQKDAITTQGDMVFRNFLTPSKEVRVLLDEAMDKMHMKRFAIFYPENAYGRFYMNIFWDFVDEMGGSITAVESYEPDETDFADQIKKMTGLFYPRPESVKKMLEEKIRLVREKSQNIRDGEESAENLLERRDKVPAEFEISKDTRVKVEEDKPGPIIDFDAIFIPDNYQRVALIAPQFPFYNIFNIQLLGTSLWQSEKLIETSGDYVQGAIIPSGFFPGSLSEEMQTFQKIYQDYFQSEPGILAANGYDTMKFVKYILKNGTIRYRRDFQSGLSQHITSGVTGYISFDKNGETEKEPILLRVSGKNFHAISDPRYGVN